MSWSTGSVAVEVQKRVPNIPAVLDSGSITGFINNAINDVTNFTGETISTTDVPNRYKNVLVNLGCVYTYQFMMGENPDINYDFKIGEFTVKNTTDSPESKSMQFCLEQANESMKMIGRKFKYNRTY